MGVKSAQKLQHMKADATMSEKKKNLKRNWPELCHMSGSQEGLTQTKSRSQKHSLKGTRNSFLEKVLENS